MFEKKVRKGKKVRKRSSLNDSAQNESESRADLHRLEDGIPVRISNESPMFYSSQTLRVDVLYATGRLRFLLVDKGLIF